MSLIFSYDRIVKTFILIPSSMTILINGHHESKVRFIFNSFLMLNASSKTVPKSAKSVIHSNSNTQIACSSIVQRNNSTGYRDSHIGNRAVLQLGLIQCAEGSTNLMEVFVVVWLQFLQE